MILNREEIVERIKTEKLVENFIDLDTQITPNGMDISLSSISKFKGEGTIDFSNKERIMPEFEEILFIDNGVFLPKGAYKLKSNEILNFPKDMIGIMRPRSTLLRMGATVDTGVIDAGFSGHLEFLLIVENQNGIKIKKDARVVQLLFLKMKETEKGYDGIYKNL